MDDQARRNRLAELLGIEVPIVLGAFGGQSSVALTAAVSNAGGLGSFGLYGYDAGRISDTAAQLRAATDRPFALNIWLPVGDEVVPDDGYEQYASRLAPWFAEVGEPVPPRPERFTPSFEEQSEAVLEARPAVLSTVFGVPPRWLVEVAHERGIRVVASATTVAEAVALDRAGVDAVIATGPEAGGHRVSFLRAAEDSLVGTFALVPQVVDAVGVPVIAAGGIADRRGVAAAFALGASAALAGTAFLVTAESAVNDAHRAAIRAASDDGTVLTRAMSGRLARGIRNRAVAGIEDAGTIAPFPAQNWITGRFRTPAAAQGRGELQSLWMGQAAPLARFDTAAEVFAELVAGVPAA